MKDAIIGFVMDRSGSMGGTPWTEAVGGFDNFVEEQRQGDAWLTLVAFDDKLEVPYQAWHVNDVPRFKEGEHTKDIAPRGLTRLYDAVGKAIIEVEQWEQDNPWFNGVRVITVITDGMENASKEYNWDTLSQLIESKKAEGWEFNFLGADVTAVQDAAALGFNSQVYDSNNTSAAYRTASAGVTASRGI